MTTARQSVRREIITPLKAIATTQRQNLLNHLHIPLFRDGYALLLGSLLTSGLGAVYWIVAARLYPDEIVGMNATVISSMMFLSVVALLNLPNALARLIPSAGRHIYRLIAYSYLIAVMFSAIAGVVFVLGADIWAPSLTLFESTHFTGWFILAVITWSAFSLQDTVFLGLRQAVYLPVLNGVFAVAKIALLAVMLGLLPETGVFASWTIPTMISLLPICYLIFRRILPQYASQARRDSTLTLSQVKRYIVADYIGNTFWWAAISLMPLIITHQIGPAATAYFYLSWSITVTLYLIAINLGAAMLVEGSGDPSRLPAIQSHVLLQMFRLVLPGVAILFVFAPNILTIFGPGYAVEATTTLRLMAISAIPNAINWFYINIARVQQRTVFIVLPLVILSISVIGFSLLLLPDYGISGVGFAWLAGQSILAVIMMLSNSPEKTYREFMAPLIDSISRWLLHKSNGQDDGSGATGQGFTSNDSLARAHELLHAGRVAFSEGNPERAHDLWREAAYLNPRDERIWLGLLKVVRDDADRRVCLENILVINPKNTQARGQLRSNKLRPSMERDITLSPLSWLDWLDRVTTSVLKGASLWLPILVIVAAVALWISSLSQIDPGQMGDMGLVSILPMAYFVSVLIILVNYCALIQFKPAFTFALILSLVALIVIIHGTPYFVYGTLRYPWAWKHIAMVDYIQRTGSVDLMTDFWSAYHNWPAFFAFNALITEISGIKSSLNYAGYFQMIFNVLNIGPLVVIFRSLTTDRRRIWLAVGFFYWTNWISQDYFSPQAFAYFLHLSILAIVLYGLQSQGVTWARLLDGLNRYGVIMRIQRLLETRQIGDYQPVPPSQVKQVGLLIIVLFCMVALVASHQLTPIMTAIALAVLVFFQITKSRGLPLILALMTVVWMFFVARPFLNVYLPEIIHSIGTLSDNVGGNLINLDYASEGLIFVSKVGRIFTVSIIFMAMLGFLQRWRKGYVDLTAVLMISSSFLMLGLNSYGGEMLFRSLYFALPFLAFLIAGLFYSVRADADQWGQSFITISLVSVVCIMTFFYPYYGKENQYYVSPYEVESIRYLQENAPQGSMISSIGPDWPITDVNYDDFYYFSFTERFEKVDREAMVEEPVERIYDILTRHDYSAAYVLITNSQRAFIETTGHYRPDSMDIILTALHEASEFEVVFENRDAIIFQAITDE